ncbi:hypothetical protein BDN71DRAFT_273754 [Pleurotus eryngii]|uniref:NOT2/NOT3/NOT5 C-terminal domain-containing protein n=1 Tax=Pleurotus eryngii TaxID=5323 RepID=A0A9P6A4W6_PLEER|nr:hypothetical protein BDN71DRAFT_273754 [Pleurotus eryngii]
MHIILLTCRLFYIREGQPQQRPPNIPNPALAGQFRPPYPSYGMPPRSVGVLPGSFVPGLQRTPTTPNVGPQASPAFIQQRAQNSFTSFPGGLGQQIQQQQQQSSQQHQHQQQQTNGTSNSMQTHLSQTPSLGGAPSASSASEVGLDPNDFPALGSTPANSSSNGANGATASYASQAGTGGVGTSIAPTTNGGNANQQSFTPEDFPALGGQSQTQSSHDSLPHPPGLNGFPTSEQHRQNLLGSLGGVPGVLNLSPAQARNVHPGFQESDKQSRNNYALKLNQATHAAWNSPTPAPQTQQAGFPGQQQQNGTHPPQNQSNHLPQPPQLNAPPGVSLPPSLGANSSNPPGTPFAANGLASEPHVPTTNPTPNTNPSSQIGSTHHPQTPAQQVLMSAADRWGLLGLLAMIKNAGTDIDHGLSSIGTDLGTMGLDMGYSGNLYSTFITPWADQSAAHTIEPDFHLPACYAVQTPPPGPAKAAAFSDETLFFMFYSSPRDALQEIAAQELYGRNWRYHKELRLWITKESNNVMVQKVPGGEQGQYTYWDRDLWQKERKELTVLYPDLEEKSTPAFLPGSSAVSPPTAQGQGQQQLQQLQSSQIQQGQGIQQAQRANFPLSLGAM